MNIEQAKVCLKGIKIISKDIFTEQTDLQDSLDTAIKSLDMWDKVIRELHELIQGDNGVELVQVGEKRALEIIERYKKEIEK